jgi:fatty acid desaturase
LATLAAIGIIAGRQVAFLNLVHAAAHCTLFSKRSFNNRVDPVIGYPILTLLRPYRLFHLLHHRDIARKSPDRFDYLHAQLPASDADGWSRAWHVIVKPLLGWAGFDFVRGAIRGALKNPRVGLKLAASGRLDRRVLATGCSIAFVIPWIVPFVAVPVFFSGLK